MKLPSKVTPEPQGSCLEQQFNLANRGAVIRPHSQYKKMLRRVGLRPTQQRMALAHILFSRGNRHVTAEALYDEAVGAKVPLSMATVYNVLKRFTEAGLLRHIGIDGSRSFFDTNPSEHHHFFVQDEGVVLDIPADEAVVGKSPQAPEGFEVVRMTVVVRLRRKQSDPTLSGVRVG